MRASQIMTANPEVLTVHDDVTRAAQVMRAADVGFLPIVDDLSSMRLEGVITDRDIAVRCVAERRGPETLLGDVMSTEHLECVRPDDDVHDVMGRMQHDRVRRIPVVDEGHRVVGVIAQADIARQIGPREPKAVEQVLEAISQPDAN